MRRFLHDNGLSVALFVLFLVSLIGQARHSVANATRLERTYPVVSGSTVGAGQRES